MYGVQSKQLQWMQYRKRWRKHPSWSTFIQRRKLSSRQMPVAKDLEHVLQKMDTWSTLWANPLKMLKRVCSNQAWSSCCILGLWEISSFSPWFPLHIVDRSKAPGINPCKISQWGNSQIAETVDKSKCLWFQCWVHSKLQIVLVNLGRAT